MRRVIVIGSTHHNSLGVIRALGEKGYEVEFVNFTISSKRNDFVSKSKYITAYHPLNGIDEVFNFLMQRPICKDKEIVISCADAVTEHLNIHSDELYHRYIIPGIPKQGMMVELMDKTTMIEMAEKRGIYAPPIWNLPADVDKVTFPCIKNVL